MPGDRHRRLALITPVLDDWESFVTLVSELDTLFAARDVSLRILAIDDGSRSRLEVLPALAPDSCIVGIEVLHLALNVGHQRAIAVGLTQVVERDDVDAVLVMDGDGEDRPADIPLLLAAADENTGHVILAQRAQRSESRAFRVFYSLYKMFFRLLTLVRVVHVSIRMPELRRRLEGLAQRGSRRRPLRQTERRCMLLALCTGARHSRPSLGQSIQRCPRFFKKQAGFSLLLFQAFNNVRRSLGEKTLIAQLALSRSETFLVLGNVLGQAFALGGDVDLLVIFDRNLKHSLAPVEIG